ncbi:MAG TPA: hypothetical protein VGG34_15820 [Opitutaceae bacterium]|jgi:hypothetical protein
MAAASAVPVQPPSFEERLKAVPWKGWDGRASDPGRFALLVDWLKVDRRAAMEFLAKNRFRELRNPAVARAVGEKATASELLEIANGAESPWDAVFGAGKWASPGVVNAMADLMPSVIPEAAGPTAGAVAGLLAGINLDRAMAFAISQQTDQVRAAAIGGIFDELRSGANGEAEIRSLYGSLPPALQNSDPVLFSYGNAIWGSDPVAALQALEGISSPKMRGMGLITLSQNAASASPETAIAAVYAAPGMSDQAIYNHVSQILQNWNAVDPQAAAKFLSTTQIIPTADVAKFSPIVAPAGGGKG